VDHDAYPATHEDECHCSYMSYADGRLAGQAAYHRLWLCPLQ
jgi:hypothetical protein